MPLKYYCPKCSKRYIDWGAEKLSFKCPECEGENLYRVGTLPDGSDGSSLKKPAAKRKAKAKAKPKAKAKAAVAVPLDDTDTADDFDLSVDTDDIDITITDDLDD